MNEPMTDFLQIIYTAAFDAQGPNLQNVLSFVLRCVLSLSYDIDLKSANIILRFSYISL